MLNKIPYFILAILLFISGCNIVKKKDTTPVLLKVEDASKEQLLNEVNRFAKVNSMRAKMDLKFEDNSYSQFGTKEVYRSADGEVVIQRPSNILLKVQVPLVKMDVAQMSSDGDKFRVAILNAGSCGEKCKKFIVGTNNADYTKLQNSNEVKELDVNKDTKENVNAFANLRPQHFTDAMLVKPTDTADIYVTSTIYQIEENEKEKKNSPTRKVMRGYYLLDEFKKDNSGEFKISRRFWFDRVGIVRLAKQQIFDEKGEIESDVVYGSEGTLGNNGEYKNLPLRIQVTRPKEKYAMSLTYQSAENVTIGKSYNQDVFVLKNTWGLEEVNLDERLKGTVGQKSTANNQ